MKIKTKLQITAIFSLCIVFSIGLTLFFTSQQVNEALEEDNIAHEIVTNAFDLTMITNDYILHPEERSKTQWHLKYDSLTKHLAGIEFKNSEDKAILDRIRQNQEDIDVIFSQLVASYEGSLIDGEESAQLRRMLSTQLSVKLQSMVSSASVLAEASQEKLVAAQQTSSLLITIFVTSIAATIGVTSWWITNTVVKPITKLHQGTEIIGSGDLTYKVGSPAKDEVGQLSRAFDRMTENLKTITTSRDELNKEVVERKKVEKELREYSKKLKKTLRQLRETQDQLVRRERLAILGQLAGGVGHELRNPLGAIKNAVYFLNMALEKPELEVKETLEILEKEVATSERIISSLLDFARPKPPTKRNVDVNDLVQEALSRSKVPENIKVVSHLAEVLPPILADPDQLDRVFDNIILNAIQAMPQGGLLTIKSETPSPEEVAVSFTDTGVGISKENLAKLFQPLFTTKAKGIGLGLAITKVLVEGHDGSIEVESEVGKGSTFTVKLPKTRESA